MALFLQETLEEKEEVKEVYTEDTFNEMIECAISVHDELMEFNEAILQADFQSHVLQEALFSKKKEVEAEQEAQNFIQKTLVYISRFIEKVKEKAVMFFTKLRLIVENIIRKVTGKDLYVPEGAEKAMSDLLHVLEESKKIEDQELSIFTKMYLGVKNFATKAYGALTTVFKNVNKFVKASNNTIKIINTVILVSTAIGLQYKIIMAQKQNEVSGIQGVNAKASTAEQAKKLKDIQQKTKMYNELVTVIARLASGVLKPFFKQHPDVVESNKKVKAAEQELQNMERDFRRALNL